MMHCSHCEKLPDIEPNCTYQDHELINGKCTHSYDIDNWKWNWQRTSKHV